MEIREIPIKDIKIVENIRQKYLDKNINELMHSIKDTGLLQPIGVKEYPIGYNLIWGARRLTACKKLGYKKIPAVIFNKKDEDMTEEEFFIVNATENLQRNNNSLLEFGRVCKILRKSMSISEIATRLGVPHSRVQSAINEMARIPLKWHSKIRIMNGDKEHAGDIPLSSASKIAMLRGLDSTKKNILLDEVSKNELTGFEIGVMGNLLREGFSIIEARKLMNDYKTTNIKFFINKKQLEEEMKKLNLENEVDFYVLVLTERFGKEFAIKKMDKHQAN